MVGWDHRFDGHEFEQALQVGDGQGSLAYCRLPGVAKSHTRLSDLNELNDGLDQSEKTGQKFTSQKSLKISIVV